MIRTRAEQKSALSLFASHHPSSELAFRRDRSTALLQNRRRRNRSACAQGNQEDAGLQMNRARLILAAGIFLAVLIHWLQWR